MTILRVTGGGWPRTLKSGVVKHIEVHLHLHRWEREGRLKRNFTIKWKWMDGRRIVRTKNFGISLKPNKTARFDWRCKDPFTGKVSTLHHVAARIKAGLLGRKDMDGRWGDHNNGWNGWETLDWRKLRVIDEHTDRDCG